MNPTEKCFAETETGACLILTCRKCQGHEKCSMYKTKEQAKADRQKAFERIASLPIEQQNSIAGVYYSGRMPWHVKG
jgi:hypothetical protein